MKTKEDLLWEVADSYLPTLSADMQLSAMRNNLLIHLQDEIELENVSRKKERQLPIVQCLPNLLIAKALLHTTPIILLETFSNQPKNTTPLMIYQSDGPNKGTYTSDETIIKRLIAILKPDAAPNDIKMILDYLRTYAPLVQPNNQTSLVPVNNGVFHYETKTLMPFSPDYIFLAKSHVDYVPNAPNPVIHNNDDGTDWDVESWFKSLSDDPEIVNLLWEITGAVLRPFNSWNKSPWLYSEKGNNGKGSFCALLRNLCSAHISIPLSDFSKPFALSGIMSANAVITDENETNAYIPDAAAFKAIITHDKFSLNQKFRDPITCRFDGLVIQCINGLPRFSDRTNSLYRRLLFVPMTKCFTGIERKYIKDDYLNRKEVLEYVMFKVLNMNYDQLSNPAACSDLLGEYADYNDPVRQFINEILPQCKWDLLPFTFLYPLYKEWFKENIPNGQLQSRSRFINDLVAGLSDDDAFECPDKTKPCKAHGKITCGEPLVKKYNITAMMPDSDTYTGSGDKRYMPPINPGTAFRGLVRK